MKDEKGGGKQSGRKRSARKHRKSSSIPPRNRQTNRSQTLAEQSGLQGRDLVMTAPQESARLIHLIDRSPLDILVPAVQPWSAVLKLSPLPYILRQQAVLIYYGSRYGCLRAALLRSEVCRDGGIFCSIPYSDNRSYRNINMTGTELQITSCDAATMATSDLEQKWPLSRPVYEFMP